MPKSLKRQAEESMNEAAKLRRTGSKNLDKVGMSAYKGDFGNPVHYMDVHDAVGNTRIRSLVHEQT